MCVFVCVCMCVCVSVCVFSLKYMWILFSDFIIFPSQYANDTMFTFSKTCLIECIVYSYPKSLV